MCTDSGWRSESRPIWIGRARAGSKLFKSVALRSDRAAVVDRYPFAGTSCDQAPALIENQPAVRVG
jgi:hypothetical protein